MTLNAKEKAKELTDKYFKGSDLLYHDLSWIQAKECALIAVNEILDAIDWHNFEFPNKEFIYWQEVKQEIEKL